MAKKQETAPESKSQTTLAEIVSSDILTAYGKKLFSAVLILAVIISGVFYYLKSTKSEKIKDAQDLGLAMNYVTNNSLDSAEMALTQYLAGEHDVVSTAKANLLLGKVYYNQKKYSEALEAYEKIKLSETEYSLITSGALHGIASCYIQQQQYDKAVESLTRFIKIYQKRSTANLHDEKVQDLSPAVPNALWKLALCYQKQGKAEESKSICQSLTQIYAGTEESGKAEKLLLMI